MMVILVFQNHVRQGLLGSVGQGERYVSGAQFGGDRRSLAVKLNGRALCLRTNYFYVAPAHAVAPARAERFHAGFFGGEARGIAFERGDFLFAVSNFALGENAAQKTVPETLDALTDARNFGDVHTSADNHTDMLIANLPFGAKPGENSLRKVGRRDRSTALRSSAHRQKSCGDASGLPHRYVEPHGREPPANQRRSCDGSGSKRARHTCTQWASGLPSG